jgi:hypothetical protein
MYFNDTEQHNTPHLHAKYGEHSAVFDLNGKKLVGKFPPKQTKIVVAWIAIHKDELSALWEIMQTSDEYFKIKGLE